MGACKVCATLIAFLVALFAIAVPIALKSSRTLKLRVAVEMLGWSGLANVVKESLAERMVGKKQTESRQAWQEFTQSLSQLDFDYLSAAKGITDIEDITEGYRHFTHIMKAAFDIHMELDPLHPRFTPLGNPNAKILGDNPDAKYHIVNLNWGQTYRVWGKVQDEAYVSFTLAESAFPGAFSDSAIGDINQLDLKLKADGKSFDLFIGAARPFEASNFLELKATKPGTFVQLITRHYWEREISVQLDPTVVPIIGIELVEGDVALPPPPRHDASMAERLKRAQAFITAHTVEMNQDPARAPAWFSFTPNTLGAPEHFREAAQELSRYGHDESTKKNAGGGLGAVDISYSGGTFKLERDEAVLMEAVIPECVFANVMLWNRYLQTLDYFNRQISLNRKQMRIDENGMVRVLISPKRPRAELGYDWLDSEGRENGRIFWRFILAKTKPPQPITTLLKLADVT